MQKRTKIVCTIGPSCEDEKTIEKMVRAGMNVARLNFSHGTYDNHAMLITNIRAVAEKTGEPVAIMQDLQGPKIRVGVLPEEGVTLDEGSEVVFDTSLTEYRDGVVPIDYDALHTFLKKDERILLADGKIEVSITHVEGTAIHTVVRVGGTIFSHKGINVPDSTLAIRALTDKDKSDAKFGVEHGVDLMALSFVTSPEDILDLRFAIKEYEKELGIEPEQPIRIIAKIERNEAVERIDEILDVVDGIMVARGDLGIEIPAEEVPIVQKTLIDKALAHAKPVIVATQMLDSMQEIPRPTRAEVSDVSNAVMDHTDAVMLSNETATGKYPVITVETMSNIIREAEKSAYDDLPMREYDGEKQQIDTVISGMSRLLAEEVDASLILAASISGGTGKLISRYRPELPIAVATNSERARHQLNLSWGVVPFILPTCRTIEELVQRSVVYLKKEKIVSPGDKLIVVAGEPVGQAGHVNLLEVREVE
jgi:pyruvate kinase